MLLLLQLLFSCPALTPKHICICRNVVICSHSAKAIGLQIFIPVAHPGNGQKLRNAVPLDEKDLGLPSQHVAFIAGEKASDCV